MPTYPLPTLACTIDVNGITAPPYSDLLASLQASFRSIFGNDAYIEADSQDGQLLAIFAQALHDANQTTIAVYNSFSPATAQGVGLSNVVKINNLKRFVATPSQVNLTITGVAGTVITNGSAGDSLGNVWLLPTTTIIPPAGTIVVTAECSAFGAVSADIGTITTILTPTTGWQTVTNLSAASLGSPIETDAELRARQEISPALNASSVLEALQAALRALDGVDYLRIYENDTASTDSNGVPEHSIAVVIQGGDANAIAETILLKKSPGVGTFGTTTIAVVDISGALRNIKFSTPTLVPIKVEIDITVGTNYTTIIGDQIKAAVAAYINNLDVGDDIVVVRLNVPAMLNGAPDSDTYKITSLEAGLVSGSVGSADIIIAFTSKATCSVANITLNVS
jgi:uncharacterized phage protein gp47/JayE